MSNRTIDVTCPRCGETTQQDLNQLEGSVEIFRGDPPSPGVRKVYSFPCRACGAPLKVTVTEGK
jgi:predicted RNA-binding Zn-ribbon protein involved in translation (DUF1610 family)